MDVAYNQHSQHFRRSNRSSTSLNHLSLAPLTSRLPFNDHEATHEAFVHTSYIQDRSAPTTPRLLSRTSSRTNLRKLAKGDLLKSKSTTTLTTAEGQRSPLATRSGTSTPGRRKKGARDDLVLTSADRNDSDWLLRAGALLTSEARESKGQAWLVSRASSTSLTAQRDAEEEEFEKQLAWERERESRRTSRRGSNAFGDADDEYSPMETRVGMGMASSRTSTAYPSRSGSRMQSRRNSHSHSHSRIPLFTPMTTLDHERESYFDNIEEFVAEPDFVDVDEDVYTEQQAAQDELVLRGLTKNGTLGLGLWMEKLMGWHLFAVEEDGEETETEVEDVGTVEGGSTPRIRSQQSLQAPDEADEDESIPLPTDEGGWQDAAWLLSVATKVLL